MNARLKRRRAEGRRLKSGVSRDDAPMLAGQLRVRGDRARRRKVEITLEVKPDRATARLEQRGLI